MTLSGSSVSLPLPDLIQATAYAGRTCCVALRDDRGRTGTLGFDHGELVRASFGELRGDDAVLALLALPHVSYHTVPFAPGASDVGNSWQHLVLESARRADEATRRARRDRHAAATPTPLPLPPPEVEAAPPPRAAPPSHRRWVLAAAAAAVTATVVVLTTLALRPASGPGAGAPSGAATGDVDDPGGAGPRPDTPPVVRDAPPPVAPAGVSQALAPTIACRLRVEVDGSVGAAEVYRPRADLAAWEAAALTAARRWRFTPARHGGAAVATWINVPLSFAATAAATRTLVVKGSDTIGGEHGVGPALARAFTAAHPDTRVIWEGLGSATAFVGLLDGSADVGASSRPVSARELAEAERAGVRLTEYVLGYDGIGVIVHPDAPVTELALPDLARVFRGELTSWRQLSPGAPDAPIRVVARPSYSGTHAFFRERILGGAELAARAELIEASEDVVAAVAADPHAISFVGMGWVTPAVRPLALAPAAGAPAVAPTPDAVRSGAYPISRPLLLYVRGLPSPAVAELLRFCTGDAGRALIAEHHLVPGDLPVETIVSSDVPASPPPAVALRVGFAIGGAALAADDRLALTALAAELRAQPRPVTVVGHADGERGGASNGLLARRRAEAVAGFLRAHGVDGRLVRVDSAGDAAPLATNRTAAGRHQNRRVDVILAAP